MISRLLMYDMSGRYARRLRSLKIPNYGFDNFVGVLDRKAIQSRCCKNCPAASHITATGIRLKPELQCMESQLEPVRRNRYNVALAIQSSTQNANEKTRIP